MEDFFPSCFSPFKNRFNLLAASEATHLYRGSKQRPAAPKKTKKVALQLCGCRLRGRCVWGGKHDGRCKAGS